MPKGEKRPAIERMPSKQNVESLLQAIAKNRADLVDADKMVKAIRENAPQLPEEMMTDIREKYLGVAFTALKENLVKIGPMLRVAVKMAEETMDAKIMMEIGNSLLKLGIFPVVEEKKEGEK